MVENISSIERVQAAIDLKKPDRVPVDLHNFQRRPMRPDYR